MRWFTATIKASFRESWDSRSVTVTARWLGETAGEVLAILTRSLPPHWRVNDSSCVSDDKTPSASADPETTP